MSQWVRKHSAELATGIRKLLDDEQLSEAHRAELQRLYGAAKELATMPFKAPEHQMVQLINEVCQHCVRLDRFSCCGRAHWTARCELVTEAAR